jgi:hypothetical protein
VICNLRNFFLAQLALLEKRLVNFADGVLFGQCAVDKVLADDLPSTLGDLRDGAVLKVGG